MLTGELKNQVDKVWTRFWSGGMANPLEIIEQITYLLFLKRLDDLQTLADNKSRRLKKPIEKNFFPKGKEKLRWNNLKNLAPEEMFNIVDKEAFPFLQNLGKTNIAFSPELVVGNTLTYNFASNFQVALLSKFVGEQFMGNIDADFSKLDSYFVNDLNILEKFFF